MSILISGASSQIGHFLLPGLVQQGHTCSCISRNEHIGIEGIRWIKADLNADMPRVWETCNADVWIHLAFLPLTIPHLNAAANCGIARLIGFSSTSIFTKQTSDSSEEQHTIQRLSKAEAEIQAFCETHGIGWTIFRPTMIYGCGTDRNIAFIQSVIERFGVFPVAGKASGLRQPVNAEDLALACIAALNSKVTVNKTYNLSGGEMLTYRAIVEHIFDSLGRKSRIISIHPALYKRAITILKRISPHYAFVQLSMVDRMNMDMVFDHADATKDFDYVPRPFQP